MKIRHRNRIRRPSLDEFIRKGPFGYISYVYTNEHGNRVLHRRRLMRDDVSVTFDGAITVHNIPNETEVELQLGDLSGIELEGYKG